MIDYLTEQNYTIWLWSNGNVDWYFNNATLQNMIYTAGMADSGAAIIMHDRTISTSEGLDELIKVLKGELVPSWPIYNRRPVAMGKATSILPSGIRMPILPLLP